MTFFFLAEDFERLCQKIERLAGRYQGIGQEMGAACREGAETWHDNFAFEEGERQQKMLAGRVRELVRVRDAARVVEPDREAAQVAIGRLVTILDRDTGERRELKIGSFMTFNGDRSVSYAAPLARLLIGARQGELREGRLAGERKQFEVVEIR